MKKLHLLILRSFVGPFLVIFSVLVLIFLVRFVLLYIDEISGKGLPISTYLELFFYFSFNSVPMILPLAVLFSTLMTYGNFGQHNELTAVKSAGVSLIRILTPVFICSVLIAFGSFYLNNTIIPKVNIKAYRLLWDIKHKKAAFNLKEGVFYNEIPSYSIKVNRIEQDAKTLRDVIIYDHTQRNKGNITHIVADSGYMELINNDSQMSLELYQGKRNAEHQQKGEAESDDYVRTDFSSSKMVFDLTSFELDETPEELFKGNRQMMSDSILKANVDSFRLARMNSENLFSSQLERFYRYGILSDSAKVIEGSSPLPYGQFDTLRTYTNAYNRAKNVSYQALEKYKSVDDLRSNEDTFEVERQHKYVQAAACIVMFLIGAPIGSVLKKGGLGIPGIITILFFIIYYVIYITFEKYARANVIETGIGSWGAVFVLLPFGLFFVYQASIDSDLFEIDFEHKIFKLFKKKSEGTS